MPNSNNDWEIFAEFKIEPRDMKIFETALTHASLLTIDKEAESYQRLEFLGDALIEFETSKYLFRKFKLDEGDMTLIRAKNVNRVALAKLSRELGLGKYLRYGRNSNDLTYNESVLADIFEAFAAAIYLDQGYGKLLNFLRRTIFREIDKTWQDENKDSKTLLQELLQASRHQPVTYQTDQLRKNFFHSTIFYEEYNLGEGNGSSKKEAEQDAAKNALSKLPMPKK